MDVAEVDRKVRWWDLMCVSTRGRSRFPSVLLHPPTLASSSARAAARCPAEAAQPRRRTTTRTSLRSTRCARSRQAGLESTSCERPHRDYRTRRRFPFPFLNRTSFQRFTRRRCGHRRGNVSDLLTSRDHLRRFRCVGIEVGGHGVRRVTVPDRRTARRVAVPDGNECVVGSRVSRPSRIESVRRLVSEPRCRGSGESDDGSSR